MNDRYRIRYIASICGACAVSVILFIAFFITGRGGIIDTYFTPETEQENAAPLAVFAEDEGYSKQERIDAYRRLLASEEMILVNKENALPTGYAPQLTQVRGTQIELQTAAAQQLNLFLDAADAAGVKYTVLSGYRSPEQQQQLYEQEYKKNQAAGYTGDDTLTAKTKLNVAPVGYSEHQTGLAVDIAQSDAMTASEVFETPFYKFAVENAYKYGFIFRYPDDKRESTGYDAKPWHLRYIGDPEQAKYITDKKISLEEYIEYLYKKIDDYEKEIDEENSRIVVNK